MAYSISISITQNSQSIANNTSNVTVKVNCSWTYGTWSAENLSKYVTINGTSYYFSDVDINPSQTTSGSSTLYTKTLDIPHNNDGTKTLKVSASVKTTNSSGTQTASASKALTTIPRKSTLSVANGTLGTAQTLTITEQASAFVHKIAYTCGSASEWILGSSSATSTSLSFSWTPPLSLAAQNTTGTSVSVTFRLYTYNGSTLIGYNDYTKSYSIPASVKPSVSIAVSDPTGYATTYGGYVKGRSKIKVVTTASGVQGSTIKSYSTSANGKIYTTATATTDVVSSSGTLTVSSTVTDSRGRTNTASKTITALAYTPAKITAFNVYRSNSDGSANSGGAYLSVKFSSSITSLSSKNTAKYVVKYKKVSDETYTSVTLTTYANNYAVTDGVYTFAADITSTYNVILTASDVFDSVERSARGGTASKYISMWDDVGIAFGKYCEREGMEVAMDMYVQNGKSIFGGTNDGQFIHMVQLNSSNQMFFGYGSYRENLGSVYFDGNSVDIRSKSAIAMTSPTAGLTGRQYGVNKILWSGAHHMTAAQTATLSEGVKAQPHGIVLAFSEYNPTSSAVQNYNWNYFFVPKHHVITRPGEGIVFQPSTGTWIRPKYMYINDTTITGNDINSNSAYSSHGHSVDNRYIVLRYVIGV